ncbi:tyrosine-type recombinase/integrase [Bifidobacterium pseudolongum]|uniref:tyrosine-type recombinase/integrase n=1 Tax=Bifidobacterium pseudolongum TaxID=1694 RepID=UPI0020A18A50|nr:site-specific integrase [Bifidobacterium pseudolongum]
MGKVIIDDRWLRCDKDGNPPDKRAKQALARAHDPLTAAVPDKWRASDYGKGSRWRCRWYVLLPDGRRKQQTKKFRRLQDAEAFAAATEDALRSGKYHDARQGNRPFGEVASAWMGTKIDLRDSTYRRYERELRIHVLPRWGGVPVGRIDTESVQQWVNSLHDGSADTVESGVPLAARTIRNIVRVVFGGAMEYARGMGYIVSDPLERVVTPRIVRHDDDMVFLSIQEVEDLADAATELGRDVDGLLVRFLAYTGVRVGEATALTVGDVDFAGGRVRVSKTWSVDRDGKAKLDAPKNGRARWAAFPSFLLADLAVLCDGVGESVPLFRAARGGTLWVPNWRSRVWTPAVRAVGLEDSGASIHSLRHTYASIAIAAGADVKTLQAQLGHASATITLDTYAGLWPERLGEVASAVDGVRARVLSR